MSKRPERWQTHGPWAAKIGQAGERVKLHPAPPTCSGLPRLLFHKPRNEVGLALRRGRDLGRVIDLQLVWLPALGNCCLSILQSDAIKFVMILLLSQSLRIGQSLGKGKYGFQMIATSYLRIVFEPSLEDLPVCFGNSFIQPGNA